MSASRTISVLTYPYLIVEGLWVQTPFKRKRWWIAAAIPVVVCCSVALISANRALLWSLLEEQESKAVTICGNYIWQHTWMNVKDGDNLEITCVKGLFRGETAQSDMNPFRFDADGDCGIGDASYAAPGLCPRALVGRVGGRIFHIGRFVRVDFGRGEEGELRLSVNAVLPTPNTPSGFRLNQGIYPTVITRHRPTALGRIVIPILESTNYLGTRDIEKKRYKLSAHLQWQPTGVFLNAGDNLEINYLKGMTNVPGFKLGPEGGGKRYPGSAAHLASDFPDRALLGRIGAKRFLIGRNIEKRLDSSEVGQLEICVNVPSGINAWPYRPDDFEVEITRTRQTPFGWLLDGCARPSP